MGAKVSRQKNSSGERSRKISSTCDYKSSVHSAGDGRLFASNISSHSPQYSVNDQTQAALSSTVPHHQRCVPSPKDNASVGKNGENEEKENRKHRSALLALKEKDNRYKEDCISPHRHRRVSTEKQSVTKSSSSLSPASSGYLSSSQISKKETALIRSKFIVENSGVLTDFYKLDQQPLGQGTYGSVCRAKKKDTGQWRAVKTISKSQVKNVERFRQEIAIMKELDHPNVVKLYETFEDHRNIYLVMELCTGGELFDRIIAEGHFTEKMAAILMKQMLSAVYYLHSIHIMHRDLKPENFLFFNSSQESPLKIIDFGLSCRFKDKEFACTKAGTPYYVAPQVLAGKYDQRCDAWSLGVILYILLCGYPPFYGDSDAEVLAKVKTGNFSFSGPEWRRISDDAKDLVRKLIKINPNERYTPEQALNHVWITNLAQNSDNVALPTTLMSNLKSFRSQNRLKKAAMTVIAQHMSEKEIENLRQIFVTLDQDASGSLSVQEVAEGLRRLGWQEIPNDLQQIIEEIDSDRSGYVDYTEFIAATMDRKLYLKEDVIWAAFRVFDLDGNGKISQDELAQVLGMPDVKDAVGDETVQALLNEVDLNGDGEIDFDEFMYMMQKRTPGEAVHTVPSVTLHPPSAVSRGIKLKSPNEGRKSIHLASINNENQPLQNYNSVSNSRRSSKNISPMLSPRERSKK